MADQIKAKMRSKFMLNYPTNTPFLLKVKHNLIRQPNEVGVTQLLVSHLKVINRVSETRQHT